MGSIEFNWQEMGKKTPTPKRQATPASSTLKKHFDKKKTKGSPRKDEKVDAEPPSVPTRQQHSGFLTYLKVAVNSKSAEASNQAEAVHRHYMGLTPSQKHQVILEFYKAGGKRPGLGICYQQILKVVQTMCEGQWEGYCTFGKLCELHKVLGFQKQPGQSNALSH